MAQQMWGAVVALHGRYPTQLKALKDKWWKDDSQTETLCALAVWRAELDDAGQDPRDEPSRAPARCTADLQLRGVCPRLSLAQRERFGSSHACQLR
jgi:hypothetical protein